MEIKFNKICESKFGRFISKNCKVNTDPETTQILSQAQDDSIVLFMKIIVISDSHNNIENLRHVMGFAQKIKAGAVIHCGDWNTVESIETVLSFGIPLYSVMGNADIEEGMEEFLISNSKRFEPNLLQFEIDGRKIAVIHNAKSLELRGQSLDIVFSGHYHSKEEKMVNFVKFVRPGVLINGINFAVYETATNEVEFFEDV